MGEFANFDENRKETDLDRKITKALETVQNREIVLDMVAPLDDHYYESQRSELASRFKTALASSEYDEEAIDAGLKGVEFGYISVDHPRGTGWLEIKETNPTDSSGKWRLPLAARARVNISMKAYWYLRGDSFNQENELSIEAQKPKVIPTEAVDPVAQLQLEEANSTQQQRNLDENISQLQAQAQTLAQILRSILGKEGFEDASALDEYERHRQVIPQAKEGDDEDRQDRLNRAAGKILEQDMLVALSFRRQFEKEKLE
jgi:hypothetical protein